MGGLIDDDFRDITSYVPTFYLKPQVFSPLEQKYTTESISGNPTYMDKEAPRYHDWYNIPKQDDYQSEHTNINQVTGCTDSKVYVDLADSLVRDHGWRLEDFDILKNKAKLLIFKTNGNESKYDLKNKENAFNKFRTTERTIAPEYFDEGRRSIFGSSHAIRETFQTNMDFHSIKRYTDPNTFHRKSQEHYDTTCKENYQNVVRNDEIKQDKSPEGIMKHDILAHLCSVEYSLDNCLEILSRGRDYWAKPTQSSIKSPITENNNEHNPCYNQYQHKYDNATPRTHNSKDYHQYITRPSINRKTSQRPTVTNTLNARRRKLGSYSRQNYTKNSMGMVKGDKYEGSTASTLQETNRVDIPNQNPNSPLEKENDFTLRKLYHIMTILKRSKKESDKSVSYEKYNNRNLKTINSSEPSLDNFSINHTNVCDSKQNDLIGDINSNLKILSELLNNSGPGHFASLAKCVSQGFAKIFGTETHRQPVRYLKPSVPPLMISDASSTPSETPSYTTIENGTQSYLGHVTNTNNNVQTSSNEDSNTVVYSNDIQPMDKRSECRELELDEWALKHELFSEVRQRTGRVASSTGEMYQDVAFSKQVLPRQFNNYISLQSKMQPRMKPNTYLHDHTTKNTFNFQREEFKEKSESDRLFGLHQHQNRKYDTDNYSKSKINNPYYTHRKHGYQFKNMYYRRSKRNAAMHL